MSWQNSFGSYVKSVVDKNKDGRISFKEILDLFPNHGVALAVIFLDLLVLLAEYRVFDVAMKITNGDIFKALGFVAVSALPFYVGQILWLYPHANFIQKAIAAGSVAASLYTSWVFGRADLSLSYDVESLWRLVPDVSAAYVVALIIYILRDNRIMAWRRKKEQEASVAAEKEYNRMVSDLLVQLDERMTEQNNLSEKWGESAVRNQLNALRGEKSGGETKTHQSVQPARAFASDTSRIKQDDTESFTNRQRPE